jgi:hypothetical protein
VDLSAIVGQELSAVEFVQDYLQLRFDGPTLALFVWPEVFREEGSYAYGEPEFRNFLCALLAEHVTAATLEEDEALEIEFESGVILRATLRSEEIAVPEAGHYLPTGQPVDGLFEF